MIKLSFQDFVSRSGIRFRRMSIFQILVAIELVCSRKCALFKFMINHLNIDKFPFHQVDVHTRTEKLFHQKRYVEAVGIETGQITTFNVGSNLLGHILEHRAIHYIRIKNAMDGR